MSTNRFRLHKILFASLAFLLFGSGLMPLYAQGFFWNPVVPVTSVETQFPKTVTNGNFACAFWQEIDKKREEIWLSCRYQNSQGEWKLQSRFAGPFDYFGSEIPDIYSATITSTGIVAVAVQASEKNFSVYVSSDECSNFVKTDIPVEKGEIFAPRIYATRNNKFILFASRSKVSNPALRLHDFYIYQSTSDDGMHWTPFAETFAGEAMPNSFVPFLCSSNGSDYIVFQSQHTIDKKNTFQIYMAHSENGGKSWSAPVHVTDDNSLDKGDYSDFDNQAPYLLDYNGKLCLVWERKSRGTENSDIWFENVTNSGVVIGSAEAVSGKGKSRKAGLFVWKNKLYAYWCDNRSGHDQIYFAFQDKVGWNQKQLSPSRVVSSFPVPFVGKDELRFVWQQTDSKENNRIVFLNPDREVDVPSVVPQDHKAGSRSKNKKVSFKIKLPSDVSGIEGYTYSWSQDEKIQPETRIQDLQKTNDLVLKLNASEEGGWFLKVRVLDRAGNWSESASVNYYLDLTPPKAIVFDEPPKDENGFLKSNYSVIRWNQNPEDSDIAGYTWKLVQVASVSQRYGSTPRHKTKAGAEEQQKYVQRLLEDNKAAIEKTPKLSDVLKTVSYFGFSNQNNGLYVLSVAAIDQVGYVGPAVNLPLILNKYEPYTVITGIKDDVSTFGDVTIEITGRDFNYDGSIVSVFVDSDGILPYDITVSKSEQNFKVSNNKITGINLGRDLEEGSYYVGVIHSDRGVCRTRSKALKISSNGTVQVENEYEYTPEWKAVTKKYSHSVYVGTVVLLTGLVLSAIGLIVFGISFIRNYAELCSTNRLIKQLETGALMTQYQDLKKGSEKRNGSLKTSLAGFTISLVILIIIVISISLGVSMIKEQERTLSKGLHDRVNVLLTSVFTGARTYLQNAEESSMEFNDLLNQMSSLVEAEFLTITGGLSENSEDRTSESSLLHVWASNDQEIGSKVNRLSSRKTIIPGISLITDALDNEQEISRRCIILNQDAIDQCGEITAKIAELNQELVGANQTRRLEISDLNAGYRNQMQTILQTLSEKGAGSIPEYNDEKFNRNVTEYLFYRPVLYSSGSSKKYVRGILFLQVNTNSLISDIDKASRNILYIVLIISFITVLVGILVAAAFASKIVKPIQMLEKIVTEISEENDKERLLAGDITDLPNNEIGRLGDSVNRMKKDLGYNERELNLQANEATPIQQSMVSLEPLSGNFKQNVSRITDKNISEFAYYKGAAGASGDYFDFKSLDGRWYVLIKCDASGHAAPAGILVTMVATLYKKYFENWSYEKNGTKLDDFVYKVNDFLESLNIKGKFVAMIICLFDSKTGNVYMCHAGDRLVRIYDNTSKLLNKLELFETPAAGPFPSFMLQMKGGFKVEQSNLKPKDVLLLYTDGIEENGRIMRTPDFAAVMKPKTDASGAQIVDEYGNLQFEPEKEEFGEERVSEIVNAVFGRKKYVLTKKNNPAAGEILEFDFTNCEGTVEECILALSSMEKLFRLYKPVTATIKDLVEVDRAIDGFLKKHFSLYEQYAIAPTDDSFNGRPVRNPKNPNNVFYAFMKEDPQEDDLTMICLQRN